MSQPTEASQPVAPTSRKPRWRKRLALAFFIALGVVFGAGLILTRTPVTRMIVLPMVEGFAGLPVDADRVRIDLDGTVHLTGARLLVPGTDPDHGTEHPEGEFLTASEVRAKLRWFGFLSGEPSVTKIEIDEPRFRVSRSIETGRLNIAGLALLFGGESDPSLRLPELAAEDGRIEIGEHGPDGYRVLRSVPVNVTLIPDGSGGSALTLMQTGSVTGPKGVIVQRPIMLRGHLGSEGAELLLDGVMLDDWPAELLPGAMRDAYALFDPSGAVERVRLLMSPSGEVSAEAEIEGLAVSLPFETPNRPADGRLMRMENTSGTVTADGRGISAKLTGLFEGLEYTVDLGYFGLDMASAYRCTFVTDFRLEKKMPVLFFVPDDVDQTLDWFSYPTGDIHAEVTVLRGEPMGETPAPIELKGLIKLADGSASFKDFPYPFADITGTVEFDAETLDLVELRGVAPSGARLRAHGWFSPIGPESEVSLDIRAEGVPIDRVLFDALDTDRRSLVEALFNAERYDSLVASGLVMPEARKVELEARADRLREELTAWSDGGISDQQHDALAEELAGITELIQRQPAFAFGGVGDVDLHTHRQRGLENIWTKDVRVEIDHAGLVPEHFPLPIVASEVVLHIDDEIVRLEEGEFYGVKGGWADVSAELRMADEQGNPINDASPDVRVVAADIPIDARLLAALPGYNSGDPGQPGSLRDMLDRLNLGGLVDCDAVIGTHDDGRISYRVNANIENLSAAPVPYAQAEQNSLDQPLLLSGLNGTINAHDDAVTIDLAGTMAGGATTDLIPVMLGVELDFTRSRAGFAGDEPEPRDAVVGPSVPGPGLIVRASAIGLDLSVPLEHAVAVFNEQAAAKITEIRRRWRPAGRLDAATELHGFVGGAISGGLTIDSIDTLSASIERQRWVLTNIAGRVAAIRGDDPGIAFDGFTASLALDSEPAGFVKLHGRLPFEHGRASDATLAGSIEGARFESPATRRMISFVDNADLIARYDELSPVGLYGLSFRVYPSGGAPSASTDAGAFPRLSMSGAIRPQSASFNFNGRRVALPVLSGTIAFEPTGGTIQSLHGQTPRWGFRVDGRWQAGDNGSWSLDTDADVTAMGLDDDLLALLPEGVTATIEGIDASVNGPLKAEQLMLTLGRDAPGSPLSYTTHGVVSFADASAHIGLDITELTGRVRFDASNGSNGQSPSFEAVVEGDRLRASKLRLSDARFVIASTDEPGVVTVPEIGATCHGGRLAGSVEIRPGVDGSYYRAEVQLAGVRAASCLSDLNSAGHTGAAAGMIPASPDAIEKARTANSEQWNDTGDFSRGLLDASLSLVGSIDEPSRRVGRGQARVAGGRVVELPGLINLIEMSNLKLPVGDELDLARTSFFVIGDTLTFEEISALSDSVELYGYGTMTWPAGDLDLRFNSRAVKPILLVSDVVSSLRDSIISARIRGTIAQPDVTTEQFPGAKRTLRAMFGDDDDRQRRLQEVERRVREGWTRMQGAARVEQARTAAADGSDEITPQTPATASVPSDD